MENQKKKKKPGRREGDPAQSFVASNTGRGE
jgi:hypothetical protein